MLNHIWFWLLVIGITYGFGKAAYNTAFPPPPAEQTPAEQPSEVPIVPDGEATDAEPRLNPFGQAGKELTEAAIDAAQLSVDICLKLIGVMILWLGILQVAKDAGMVDALARALRPVTRWLFPDVPDGHPAQGAILMNMSANMLGLDNAATPFGLKAMNELQEINPDKDSASNAMATFLAINTSSVTLIPITVIALRSAYGSNEPASPLFGILLATTASTIAAVIAVRWLSRLPRYAVTASSGAESSSEESEENLK